MTPEEVKAEVEKIRKLAGDPESAHAHEDCLYEEVLRMIANGHATDPARCAEEALKTQGIKFPRWCA